MASFVETMMTRKFLLFQLLLLCPLLSAESRGPGIEIAFYLEAHVYVPLDSDELFIKHMIAKQTKTLLGAMRAFEISPRNTDPFKAHHLEMNQHIVKRVDKPEKIKKVTYRFHDRAVIHDEIDILKILEITLLNSNADENIDKLVQPCADGFAFKETLWYFYEPQRPSCQNLIDEEAKIIRHARALLEADQVSLAEINRMFSPGQIFFKADGKRESTEYPDYSSIISGEKPLQVYMISGIDSSSRVIKDRFGLEYIRFLQNIAKTYTSFRSLDTNSQFLTLAIDNIEKYNISFADLFKWILNQSDLPLFFYDNEEKITQLSERVIEQFADKWRHWEFLLESNQRVQVHTFYGFEGDNSDQQKIFRDKFLEAYKLGDIIIYNGHSYLGRAVIAPHNFSKEDFKKSYQLIFFNSCGSYSLFGAGYENIKGDDRNLDILANGLSSQIKYSGDIMAEFLKSVFLQSSFKQIIASMLCVPNIKYFPLVTLLSP